jgi:hypothetical protein
VRRTERSAGGLVGSATGASEGEGVALGKENVTPPSVGPELARTIIDDEALVVGAEAEALALELVATLVEEEEVTSKGTRVDAVGAEQSVAETVTVLVETMVTVTKPSVPMTRVGVLMLPEDELVVGVITGIETEEETEDRAEEDTETVEDVPVLVEEAVGVAELEGVLRVRI